MKHPGFHLFVLSLVALAIVVALIAEGLGFAMIVALALGIVLAIGFPLLAIRAEQRQDRPVARRRP